MRKNIVAGNWKMNCNLEETKTLLNNLKKEVVGAAKNVEIIVAPSFTNLYPAVEILKNTEIGISAQDVHQEENGAYTGEVSAGMLKSIGVNTVILGHSERRKYFGETKEVLNHKVDTALKNNFKVIFCVGESLEKRENDQHFNVVKNQLSGSLFYVDKAKWTNIIIAYEPVWAIGTGKTASAKQAQEMHKFIREEVAQNYDQEIADNLSILYGGSVKPANAQEIFAEEDVDGGLIGGASLNTKDFTAIINSFK